MANRHRRLGSIAVIVCSAALMTSCAHAINDDGNDITNPQGHNPGTHTLLATADRTDLGVGESAVITVTYDGATIAGGVPGNALTASVSDPGVITGGGNGAIATSVGSATVTLTYQGVTATLSFTVHRKDGIDALLYPVTNQLTGVAMWTPPGGVHVPVGSTVEFTMKNSGVAHNIIFDAIPGAPEDIGQTGTTTAASRLFQTAGVFTFTCTLHGETGIVTILQ
ncbi:MAG TPA: hypothetical protein VGQ30_15245 [Gemmatimonadaceae bacterium]|nr:hypothetical protein [Gemmatimonadaceae bacterium]